MAVNPYIKKLKPEDINRAFDLIEIFDESDGLVKNITPNDLFSTLGPSPFGGLYTQTAQAVPVTNTTVESSIINGGVGSLTVPADYFQVGDTFHAFLSGSLSAVNNHTIQFHVHSNSASTILTDSGLITLSGTTAKDWEMDIHFVVREIGPAGIAKIYTSGKFLYNKDANNNPEKIAFSYLNNTTFNTRINNTLQVLAQWGTADPLDSISTDIFILNKLY